MKVKVILQTEVAGLGEEGDVKEVAGGYARNYLLPRKLVVPATKGNLTILEQQRAQIVRKQEQRRAEARTLADRLAGVTLLFPVRVGEQGRLYGSITASDIAARLQSEQGITLDRRALDLKEPLRTLGEFEVPVRVAHTVTAHLKVVLYNQNAGAPGRAAAAPGTPPSTESGPEALGEDAVPLGAAPADTVVPASETPPEPFDAAGAAGAAGATEETGQDQPTTAE